MTIVVLGFHSSLCFTFNLSSAYDLCELLETPFLLLLAVRLRQLCLGLNLLLNIYNVELENYTMFYKSPFSQNSIITLFGP